LPHATRCGRAARERNADRGDPEGLPRRAHPRRRAAPGQVFRRALPNADGVVLSLAKLKRIIAIDPLARTAVVQPGVRNSPFPTRWPPLVSTTRPTRRHRSHVRSAAMRRERGRRTLPRVWSHCGQRAAGARLVTARSSSWRRRVDSAGYDCWRSSPAVRNCWW
jgi:hypothetical protein